jgi:hypothetical protein
MVLFDSGWFGKGSTYIHAYGLLVGSPAIVASKDCPYEEQHIHAADCQKRYRPFSSMKSSSHVYFQLDRTAVELRQRLT